ncbi:uncharacterized protein LOC129089057 [Anoplopoma fimbria]|uniref:uncharacterized protein LOC129089057 n=1 Tax=Anoplopoma fimbria TaxID=229290 RepID=UPI0023EBA9D3|nr:uncharacterized protein LOC129089057 [Anoplopoma fimbria]
MSRRRCVLLCEVKCPLYGLPKEEDVRNEWVEFIFKPVPVQYNANLLLCSRHFTEDCFENWAQYTTGFSKRLLLKEGSVPSLLGPRSGSGSQPRTSQRDPDTLPLPFVARLQSTGTQTDPPPTASVGTMTSKKMVSVATQLSWGTLRSNRRRSKAIQVKMSCVSVGTETTTLSSTSVTDQGFRPSKRPRVEVEEEEEEEEEEVEEEVEEEEEDPLDPTYGPIDSDVSEESEIPFESSSSHEDAKYIVFDRCLRELFDICPVCKQKCDVQRRQMGTYVAFTQLCRACDYSRRWHSQPVVGSTPVGNLQLSAATYFTGGSFTQLEKICKAMQLQMFQYDTFRRHARSFLEPAIVHKWKSDQYNLLQRLHHQGGAVSVGGDMRADLPGLTAKYGSYTLMHLESNTIVDLQLVQSDEVAGRYHMEKEGLTRCLGVLGSNGLAVDYIVTDCDSQIQKFLRERKIPQFYDARHFEKGLSKKLSTLSKDKDCEVLKRWLPNIKQHVYWTASSSTSGPEKVAKWTSQINHMQNVHVHEDPIFPKCEHPNQSSRGPSKWLQPGSVALHKVEKVLVNQRVVKNVEKLSHHYRTPSLEDFHSVIQRFTPKNAVFPFMGMLCRLYLAVMHYNENAEKATSTGTSGSKSKKGELLPEPVKTKPTYNYVDELMKLVFEEVFEDPTPFVDLLKTIPIPNELPSQCERPSQEEVFSHHVFQNTDQSEQESPGVSGEEPTKECVPS